MTVPGEDRRAPLLKRVLPRSLLGRSMMIMVTPVVVVQAIAAFVFFERHWDVVSKRLSQGVAGQIAAVVEMLERDSVQMNREQIFRMARETMWLQISFRPGAELPADAPEPQSTTLDRRLNQALAERLPYAFAIDTHSLPEDVLVLVETPDGLLRIIVARQQLFTTTIYLLIFWMVGTSILLIAVAAIFLRNQVRPIRRLALAAERFGKGQDVPEFKPEGAREVRQASAAFLQMRERIKRQITQRTDMLAGVSHDLRTPLTRMKLQLAMLGDSPGAASLKSDVGEMERMVEGYLAFARGEGTEQPQATDLGALLREAVEQAKRNGASIDLHLEENLDLPLRRQAFRRCLDNLLANALRHGETVAVRAGRRRGVVEITVDDDGPGIPPDKREAVFRPFYRLDQSRNPATGGTGLGLSIARDVLRGHGGDVTLENAPGGGLRARVRLPV